jgi:predicted transcriptional regulator
MDIPPKLTDEQSQALHQAGDELPILDPSTNKFYVVVEQSVHEQAKAALQRQQSDDVIAIREGIADMKAGRVMPLEVAHQEIKRRFAEKYGPDV